MSIRRLKARMLQAGAVAALVLAPGSAAKAQTYTWSGAAGSPFNWNLAGNWDTLPIPGATADLVFNNNVGTSNNNNFVGGFQAQSITFGPLAASYSIAGNAIQFISAASAININNNNNQTINAITASNTLTVSNGAGNTGGLILNGVSILNSGGAQPSINTGTVATTLNGNVTFDGNGIPSAVVWSGSTLNIGAAVRTFNLGATFTGSPSQDFVFRYGNITGTGGLTFSGAIWMAIDKPSAADPGWTFSGDTTFATSGNPIFLGSDNVLSPASTVVMTSGVLNLFANNAVGGVVTGSYSQTIGALSGASQVVLGNAVPTTTLTAGGNNASTTFTGIMSNAGSFVKTGTGVMTVSGASTYTGSLTIANGAIATATLNAPGVAGPLGQSAAAVNFILGGTGTTGTLQYTGAGPATYARNFTLATGGTGALGGSGGDATYSGVFDGAGNLGKNGGGTAILTGTNSFTGNIAVTGGVLAFSGTTGTANTSGNVAVSGSGTLLLDNAAGAVQRLNNTTAPTVALNSGEVRVVGNATANLVGNTELFGALNVQTGASAVNRITLSNTGGTNNLDVRFASLNISGGASVLFRGDNLGAAAGVATHIFFTTSPGAGAITGAFYDSSASGTGLSQAAYDATRGIIAFVSPISTQNILDNLNAFPSNPVTPTTNSFTTAGTGTILTVNAGATVSSLTIAAGFDTVNFANLYGPVAGNANAPAGTLVLSSGLFQTTTAAATVTVNGAAGGSTLSTSGGFTINNSQNVVFAANMTLSGAGLNKLGAGALTINGTNSITGPYSISAGNVTLANGGAAASLATAAGTTLTLTAGTLTLNGAAGTTVDGTITGAGSLSKLAGSTGNTALTAANPTFTGGVSVAAGTVTASLINSLGTGVATLNGGAIAYTGAAGTLSFPTLSVLAGGGSLALTTAAADITLSSLTGSGALTKTGAANLLVSAGTYTGALTVTNAVLRPGANGALGTPSSITLTGGTAAGGTVFDLNNFNQTIGSLAITGGHAGQVTIQTGTGTLTLGGNISAVYSGAIPDSVPITGIINLGGADRIFDFGAPFTNAADHDTALLANLVGTGGITYRGGSWLAIGGVNTYSGATVFEGTGARRIGSSTAIPATSALTVATGTTLSMFATNGGGGIVIGQYNVTAGSLAGGGGIAIGNAAPGPILSIGGNNASTAFTGVLSGPGSFVKTGTGTLTLGGANTFTGDATVNGGTLLVNGSMNGSAAIPSLSVAVGATLGGTGTIGTAAAQRNVSIQVGATLAPGVSPGTLTINGNLTITGNYSVELNGTTAGTQYDQTAVSGTVDVTNGTLLASIGYIPAVNDAFIILNNTGAGAIIGTFTGRPEGSTFLASGNLVSITYVGGTGANDIVLTVITPVPEPATMLLIGAAGFGVLGLRRRTRKAAETVA